MEVVESKDERSPAQVKETTTVEVNELQEALDGYVLNPALYPDNAHGLKTTPDGKYVLIPQPSDSPRDPLNWSPRKKAVTLAIIAYIAALADYTGGTAIITVIPQAAQWQMTPAAVQRAVTGNIFAIGACGLFVVALANYFGRVPVTLVFQALFFATCAWSAAATTFTSYFAARIVNGLFCSHPRAINYVELSIIISPYLGPLITAFIVSGAVWRWAFWLCTILAGISLALVFFMDETLYDRSITDEKRLNTTVSIWLTEFYAFTPRGIGFFYFFGIIGPLIGWFIGHWMHDAVGRYYARRYGHIDPEARLIIAYPATLLLFVALLVIGYALEHTWHYMILAVFSSVQCIGVMIVTTAINAYLLDCYPEGSGEVGAWITASRNWSGFMATYIQITWVTSAGPAKAFGAQAGITVASMLILVVLQLYGKKMRKAQGRMVFDRIG
ncbi:hypothetical protein LTR08_008486 [Meristemomyces frigidus]|nr:hypothetical protein LTR08_008486 [Meristemomyces frigidus]